jgi:hypothetical protein
VEALIFLAILGLAAALLTGDAPAPPAPIVQVVLDPTPAHRGGGGVLLLLLVVLIVALLLASGV